ncbi:NAD(P)-dependent oxidoreductase [Mycolicibacterium sp.]|uniref:NAD-dependent epimerase/dehydratase family protein n=1 Tax=Mycolicibacterium sp. TaxID=2320850 RepID=UPI001D7F1F93|nr:NAD(P)-dependent oxidoreductase [Mycolicibacterium sp.]MCB1291269.1 NAD(P)-dependent oxidoreductase [Mycobacterium sp.]MCB9410880.1 NAD(P)-dependent oxidoreductase [Mycolicibacterium sp.]
MSDAILVTGALGLVGRSTVAHLARQGAPVVATDLHTPANRRAALPGIPVRWADLTDPAQVAELLSAVRPATIIHLAAMIPPMCYSRPALARAVNVDATGNLLEAAATLAERPRFIQASSIAVYGPRNPHRVSGLLTAETPVRPYDLYGQHKVESERMVRDSGLDWVTLRLGGVLSVDIRLDTDPNLIYFEGVLPSDGRLQTVDVRDVAHAFAASATADVVGRTLLIGGDDSHRLVQGEIGAATAAAMGLVGALPPGRRGDPDDDDGWFATDWMDSAPAQLALGHQHHSWPQMLAETAQNVGWKRYPLRLVAPLARRYLERQSPYYREPGGYANPWEAVRRKWGAPEADRRIA